MRPFFFINPIWLLVTLYIEILGDFAQLEFLNFSARGARKFSDNLESFWPVIFRQLLLFEMKQHILKSKRFTFH